MNAGKYFFIFVIKKYFFNVIKVYFRYGPTTRRKWQDYVSELEQQKKKKDGNEDIETLKEDEIKHSSTSLSDNNLQSLECDKDDSKSDDIPIKKKFKRSYDKKKDKTSLLFLIYILY